MYGFGVVAYILRIVLSYSGCIRSGDRGSSEMYVNLPSGVLLPSPPVLKK